MAGIQNTSNILHRITLAWAISECALGGFLHAIKSPFTGLLVGGLAVIFISLLAYHSRKPTITILQSLVFVLGVKMAVSPHSPIGAYLAVSIQAFLGIVFFKLIPKFSIAAILVGITSAVASAMIKVLILTILFGEGLWIALDAFSKEVVYNMSFLSFLESFSLSKWLVGIYLGGYAIGGLLMGVLGARIPFILEKRSIEFDVIIEQFHQQRHIESSDLLPNKKFKIWPYVIVFILLGLSLQWLLFSAESAFHQLIRTVGVIAIWLFVFRPIFKWILARFLKSKQSTIQSEIEQVQTSIPALVSFAKFAWKYRGNSGRNSLISFITIYVYYAVYRL